MINTGGQLGQYLKMALENPSFFTPTASGSYVTGSLIKDRLDAIKNFVESEAE